MSTTSTTPIISAPLAPVAPTPSRLTAEEFIARHSGDYCELVDGIVKELPRPGLEHGILCMTIGRRIGNHVDAHDLGRVAANDTFVKTGLDKVRGADVLFYSYERLPKGQPIPEGSHSLAPDLVVEVKSPNDTWIEIFAKLGEYLKAGVRVVVLIDPRKPTVSVYRNLEQDILTINDALTLPDVLPGFSVPVRSLFP